VLFPSSVFEILLQKQQLIIVQSEWRKKIQKHDLPPFVLSEILPRIQIIITSEHFSVNEVNYVCKPTLCMGLRPHQSEVHPLASIDVI